MKVSIIVPAYNAENTICATVDSLLNQSYRNKEIIIIDDGSTDSTAKVLEKYGESLRIIRKKNGGVSSARNHGIREATGACIMFVDADDVCPTDMIESLVKRMEDTGADYVIAGYTKIKENNSKDQLPGSQVFLSQGEIRDNLEKIMDNGLNCPYAKLYRKNIIIEKSIFFDEKLPLGEDFNFNLEYLLTVSSLAYLNKSVYNYQMFNSTATTVFRDDLYERRMMSLNKMTNTFAKYNLVNPKEDALHIKMLYAELFNLQKKECPYKFRGKINRIKVVKRSCLKASEGKTTGIYRLLEETARILPARLLYAAGVCIRVAMAYLPEKLRGLSV